MTLREAFDDLALLLGYEDGDDPPTLVRERVFRDLLAAIQQMHSGGEDFFTREPYNVTLAAGTSQYILEKEVQRVLEPARIGSGGGPLRRLTSRAQVADFGPLFLSQTSRTLANGTPIAYYAEPTRESDVDDPDSKAIAIHVLPPPSAGGTLTLTVIQEPRTFTMEDLDDAAAVIPVPDQYIASVFMPIARWNLATHPRFYRRDMMPALETAYTRALELLGVLDPRRLKPADSNSNAISSGRTPQEAAA